MEITQIKSEDGVRKKHRAAPGWEGLQILAGSVSTGTPVPTRNAGQLSWTETPTDLELRSGYRQQYLQVPLRTLEAAMDQLTGVPRTAPVRFNGPIDFGSAGGATVLQLLDFILEEAGRTPQALAPTALESRLAKALVRALLIGLRNNHSHLLRSPGRAPGPRYLQRAEDYLELNTHRNVPMSEVAATVGVSVRTLFAAFRAHRDSSPMAFLRDRRYELARVRLTSSTARTVAEAAFACGFEHLGRFSTGYRERFGESPAETLRRGRDRVVAPAP